jgi:RNA polymerase sigma factor (sigma-70 family)
MASFDFEQAYDEHAWRLFGFFAHRVGSRADVEDLTQMTFERALGAWESYDPSRASIGTWLFTIAGNLLIDHHRAAASPARRGSSWDALDPSSEPRVDEPEQELELSAELARALAMLSDREREVLSLRFGADLKGPQIAATMQLTLSNVQQILSRALRKLRVALDQAGETDGAPQAAGATDAPQNASGPTPASPSAASASSNTPQAR